MFSLLTLITLEVVKFTSLTSLKVTLYVSVLVGNSLVVSTSPLLIFSWLLPMNGPASCLAGLECF